MSPFDILAFFAIMVTLAAIPSTSVALVVTRSASSGFLNGAAVAAGIVLGDLMFALLAILGLTTLSEILGIVFLAIKYAAGLYLIWFGITLIKSRSNSANFRLTRHQGGIFSGFLAGLLVTLGDIKAIFFYASLFPTFLELSALTRLDIGAILLVIFMTVGGVKLAYALAARRIASMVGNQAIARGARRASGCLLVGAGTYLIARA